MQKAGAEGEGAPRAPWRRGLAGWEVGGGGQGMDSREA